MQVYLNIGQVPSWKFRRSEWGLALMSFGWGAILLAPGDTFALPSFFVMAQWAPENVWGVGAMAIGGVRLAVLTINGRWRKCNHGRAITAGLTCFLWSSVWLGLLLSVTNSTGLAVYGVLLLMDMHTVYDAMGDARAVDEAHHGGG